MADIDGYCKECGGRDDTLQMAADAIKELEATLAARDAELAKMREALREKLEGIIIACDDATRAPIASEELLVRIVRRRVNDILSALASPPAPKPEGEK